MRPKESAAMAFDIGCRDADELLAKYPLELLNHSRRVAVSAAMLGEHAGDFIRKCDLPEGISLPAIMYLGGICHDAGKLIAPPLSGGVTDEAEYFRHPVFGAELLNTSGFIHNHQVAEIVKGIAAYHHERPDGRGFPAGLSSRDIPLAAALCSVADALDHMLCPLAGKNGDREKYLMHIKAQSGTRFCESAVVCLERAWGCLWEQYRKWTQ